MQFLRDWMYEDPDGRVHDLALCGEVTGDENEWHVYDVAVKCHGHFDGADGCRLDFDGLTPTQQCRAEEALCELAEQHQAAHEATADTQAIRKELVSSMREAVRLMESGSAILEREESALLGAVSDWLFDARRDKQ